MVQAIKTDRFKKIFFTSLTCIVVISGITFTASAKDTTAQDRFISFLSVLGLNYDKEEKTLCGPGGIGLAASGFDYDLEQEIFFSAVNCWQRNFGYNSFYDDAAPFVFMYFDCLRFYFDYNGKNWLIEAWKGQYGITTGCEVGVYNKPAEREIMHFDCVTDEEMLPISVTLNHEGSQLFDRSAATTWWQTGFVMFRTESADELDMIFSITFPNKGMLTAFQSAVKDNINIEYSFKNNTFNCTWEK